MLLKRGRAWGRSVPSPPPPIARLSRPDGRREADGKLSTQGTELTGDERAGVSGRDRPIDEARWTPGVEGFITPSNGVADGDVVTISVTGLTPGRNGTATMCWEGEGGFDWMEIAGITVMSRCDTSTVAGGDIDVVGTGLFDYFLRCMFGGAPGALVGRHVLVLGLSPAPSGRWRVRFALPPPPPNKRRESTLWCAAPERGLQVLPAPCKRATSSSPAAGA